jgi:hypothetical protein
MANPCDCSRQTGLSPENAPEVVADLGERIIADALTEILWNSAY